MTARSARAKTLDVVDAELLAVVASAVAEDTDELATVPGVRGRRDDDRDRRGGRDPREARVQVTGPLPEHTHPGPVADRRVAPWAGCASPRSRSPARARRSRRRACRSGPPRRPRARARPTRRSRGPRASCTSRCTRPRPRRPRCAARRLRRTRTRSPRRSGTCPGREGVQSVVGAVDHGPGEGAPAARTCRRRAGAPAARSGTGARRSEDGCSRSSCATGPACRWP